MNCRERKKRNRKKKKKRKWVFEERERESGGGERWKKEIEFSNTKRWLILCPSLLCLPSLCRSFLLNITQGNGNVEKVK